MLKSAIAALTLTLLLGGCGSALPATSTLDITHLTTQDAGDNLPPNLVREDGPAPQERSSAGESTTYVVIMNHEEMYSIWPEGRALPLGWHPVGVSGTREECLAYIEEVWIDMRPISLR